jgi:hypothetical protein
VGQRKNTAATMTHLQWRQHIARVDACKHVGCGADSGTTHTKNKTKQKQSFAANLTCKGDNTSHVLMRVNTSAAALTAARGSCTAAATAAASACSVA